MDQRDTPTLDPDQPDPQTNGQQSPEGEQSASMQYTRARIFLFILLPILILLFSTNTVVISVITTMLILLSISSIFDPVSRGILRYSDKLLMTILKPFGWVWTLVFVKHLTRLGNGLTRRRRSLIDIMAVIAIVVLLGATTLKPWFATGFGNLNDAVCLNTGIPWPTCDRGLGVSNLPDPNGNIRIGLIMDNSYGPFDQSTLNSGETQVEGLIFGENKQACAGQHITLIVVTMLSRTVKDATSTAEHSLQELQGSYLAQRDYNANRPAVSICLAIANLGTADTANNTDTVARVIHRIAQFAHADPSLRGIVGFRNSQPATEALGLIKSYQDLSMIPIISPSASSDGLSNVPNFYRIVSPDHSQGAALAQFFCDGLMQNQSPASIAILRDSKSAYSSSLQLAFSDALKCVDPRQTTIVEYTNYDTGSIQQAVDQALSQQPLPRYLFFPGYDIDMDTVEQEIYKDLPGHASDVTIISGDGTNNVDATTHYSYVHVYNTTFVGPLLLENGGITKSFMDLKFYLPESARAIPSHVWIPADALLDYDAISAFAQAERNIPSGAFSPSTFNTVLASISITGTTGQVTFQGGGTNGHSSDRNQGYIYITCNDLAHTTHLVAEYSTTNNGSNSPAQDLPLSRADGASSCS